jgi:hypothetical protein
MLVNYKKKDFLSLFSEKIITYNTITEKALSVEKSKIDNTFFLKLKDIETIDNLKTVFKQYLEFFDFYQNFITEDLALYFLNNLRSDIRTIPENTVVVHKDKVDSIFFNKIKGAKNVEEIQHLFKGYLIFYDTYKQFTTADFATFFLNQIIADNVTNVVKRTKEEIDNMLFKKLECARSIEELNKLFDNYIAFFDTYQEYIPYRK